MKKENFEKLIQFATGRDFVINTSDTEIEGGKEYHIYRTLPHTHRHVSFKWKAALNEEKMLRSFITSFTTKYREPNPAAYTTCAPYYSKSWHEKTQYEQECAYMHHASNMYSKKELMEQVQTNFGKSEMRHALIRYGFYATQYGVGIFCFFETEWVINAINEMKNHLRELNIPFANEYSDARWVYRFKINLSKEAHEGILERFTEKHLAAETI